MKTYPEKNFQSRASEVFFQGGALEANFTNSETKSKTFFTEKLIPKSREARSPRPPHDPLLPAVVYSIWSGSINRKLLAEAVAAKALNDKTIS